MNENETIIIDSQIEESISDSIDVNIDEDLSFLVKLNENQIKNPIFGVGLVEFDVHVGTKMKDYCGIDLNEKNLDIITSIVLAEGCHQQEKGCIYFSLPNDLFPQYFINGVSFYKTYENCEHERGYQQICVFILSFMSLVQGFDVFLEKILNIYMLNKRVNQQNFCQQIFDKISLAILSNSLVVELCSAFIPILPRSVEYFNKHFFNFLLNDSLKLNLKLFYIWRAMISNLSIVFFSQSPSLASKVALASKILMYPYVQNEYFLYPLITIEMLEDIEKNIEKPFIAGTSSIIYQDFDNIYNVFVHIDKGYCLIWSPHGEFIKESIDLEEKIFKKFVYKKTDLDMFLQEIGSLNQRVFNRFDRQNHVTHFTSSQLNETLLVARIECLANYFRYVSQKENKSYSEFFFEYLLKNRMLKLFSTGIFEVELMEFFTLFLKVDKFKKSLKEDIIYIFKQILLQQLIDVSPYIIDLTVVRYVFLCLIMVCSEFPKDVFVILDEINFLKKCLNIFDQQFVSAVHCFLQTLIGFLAFPEYVSVLEKSEFFDQLTDVSIQLLHLKDSRIIRLVFSLLEIFINITKTPSLLIKDHFKIYSFIFEIIQVNSNHVNSAKSKSNINVMMDINVDLNHILSIFDKCEMFKFHILILKRKTNFFNILTELRNFAASQQNIYDHLEKIDQFLSKLMNISIHLTFEDVYCGIDYPINSIICMLFLKLNIERKDTDPILELFLFLLNLKIQLFQISKISKFFQILASKNQNFVQKIHSFLSKLLKASNFSIKLKICPVFFKLLLNFNSFENCSQNDHKTIILIINSTIDFLVNEFSTSEVDINLFEDILLVFSDFIQLYVSKTLHLKYSDQVRSKCNLIKYLFEELKMEKWINSFEFSSNYQYHVEVLENQDNIHFFENPLFKPQH
eukprot:TRINITY_DN1196_c0_g1_i1.p1 TRINITY_DN1196_c0_g1~~TRINITY_DN1196_c0_g1_i1.p1  ORF type:complete len:908 (+),score=245.11 TRINITY_DN1196_c0_g1_i1:102-2825(+)